MFILSRGVLKSKKWAVRFVVTVDGNVQDAEIEAPISSVTAALNVDVTGETNMKYSAFVF